MSLLNLYLLPQDNILLSEAPGFRIDAELSDVFGSILHGLAFSTPEVRLHSSQNECFEIQPNPCTLKALVYYTIPEKGLLTIAISDAAGRAIIQLDKGLVEARQGQFDIDVSMLKSGAYYCRFELQTENGTLIEYEKMIVNPD